AQAVNIDLSIGSSGSPFLTETKSIQTIGSTGPTTGILRTGNLIRDSLYSPIFSPCWQVQAASPAMPIVDTATEKALVAYDPIFNQYNVSTPPGYKNKNTGLFVFSLPITHSQDEVDYRGNDDVHVSLDMEIRSVFIINGNDNNITDANINILTRETPAPFNLVFRFLKYDGTYIDNEDWVHSFTASDLGVGGLVRGKGVNSWPDDRGGLGYIRVNNFPDGDEGGGFREFNTVVVPKLIKYQISDLDTDPHDMYKGEYRWKGEFRP
ncbi:unnamed protein product, partial [marine sediment metagenome]